MCEMTVIGTWGEEWMAKNITRSYNVNTTGIKMYYRVIRSKYITTTLSISTLYWATKMLYKPLYTYFKMSYHEKKYSFQSRKVPVVTSIISTLKF